MVIFTLILVDIFLLGAIIGGVGFLIKMFFSKKKKEKEKKPVGFFYGLMHSEELGVEVTGKKK